MPLIVNGEAVDSEALRTEANSIRASLYDHMRSEDARVIEARVKEWARENVIERVLLRQAAQAAHPGEDLERAVEKHLAKVTENVARPRNKDVVEYYRKNKAELWQPETVSAGHILKKVDDTQPDEAARTAMEGIRERLTAGEVFEALAAEASDDRVERGYLGFFRRGEMDPAFESAVFALKPGEISGLIRTRFGYHVAKLYERREPGIPKLEDLRPALEETIYQQKRQKVIEQYLDRLRARAEVSL